MSKLSIPPEFAADQELDTCGLLCPEPVMLLHQRINQMEVGETIRVLATDPSTHRDFTRFCQFLNHELLREAEQEGVFYFLVRKGE